MISPRLGVGDPKTEVIAGTDHVAVGFRLPGELHRLLGYRLVQPAPLDTTQLDRLRTAETREALANHLGDPPELWAD